MNTREPLFARREAKFTASVVFPVPPLYEWKAIDLGNLDSLVLSRRLDLLSLIAEEMGYLKMNKLRLAMNKLQKSGSIF